MKRLAWLLLWSVAALAQTVQGVAVNSATRKPVAGANVQLIGVAEESDPDIYRTQSDAAGRFRIEHVAPGRYRAVADAQGFTRMMPAGNIVERAPRLAVNGSAGTQEISIAMIPASVITGHVSDQDGDPLRFVSVEALQYGYQAGKKILKAAASVRTDDRGEYRLFGLMPGRYYLRVSMRASGASGYSPLFFPAARDVSQAALLNAAPGEELRSIDLVMRPDTLHSVSGRVVDGQTGQAIAEVYVMARTEGDTFANGAAQMGDGFSIQGLPPGKYVLSAQQVSGNAPKAGRVAIDLGNADISGVLLTISSGLEVTGTVRGLPADAKQSQLTLQPENSAFDSYTENLTAKGSFAFHNVRPDVYHLMWSLPKGVYVQSIKQGDRTLRDDRVDLSGAVSPLTLQLASDGARVQGTVRNGAGEAVPGAVVTMTADPSYDSWSATCDDAGHFEIRDIAPGEYKLLAFDGAPQGAPQDPDFRKPYEKNAVKLQVFPSTQQKQDLTAISAQ
ncbi:MAG TPA: carboxypeptidase-like regulatory domain-containing protein [Candidatus Sulfopaludibacter sp.]|nr:carboxypeptidase-like regulatory domain-containing protein [Candidatus Sulfopaludibacter sp.]